MKVASKWLGSCGFVDRCVFLNGASERPSGFESASKLGFVHRRGVFECLRNCIKVDLCTGAVFASWFMSDLSAGAVFLSPFSSQSGPKLLHMLDLSAGAVVLSSCREPGASK